MWGMPTSLKSISGRLIATRLAKGLKQSEFADRAGVARNTYNQYEKGISRPQIDEAIKLCETHGLTLEWIYRGISSGLPSDLAGRILTPLKARAS